MLDMSGTEPFEHSAHWKIVCVLERESDKYECYVNWLPVLQIMRKARPSLHCTLMATALEAALQEAKQVF